MLNAQRNLLDREAWSLDPRKRCYQNRHFGLTASVKTPVPLLLQDVALLARQCFSGCADATARRPAQATPLPLQHGLFRKPKALKP